MSVDVYALFSNGRNDISQMWNFKNIYSLNSQLVGTILKAKCGKNNMILHVVFLLQFLKI